MENPAEGRVDEKCVARGNRVRERDIFQPERSQFEVHEHVLNDKLDLSGQPFFLELPGDQSGGEWRRIERHSEIVGEIGNGSNMILMTMREDNSEQVRSPLLD